jgi:hypothetical protein
MNALVIVKIFTEPAQLGFLVPKNENYLNWVGSILGGLQPRLQILDQSKSV